MRLEFGKIYLDNLVEIFFRFLVNLRISNKVLAYTIGKFCYFTTSCCDEVTLHGFIIPKG